MTGLKLTSLFFLFFLESCNSQEKIENKMTTDERLSKISEKIKKYDSEPLYQIKVKTQNCYQILVNDFPVYTYFDKMSGKIGLNINSAILKSGIQTLQIKIYPSYNSQNIQNEYLTNKDFFSLEIEQTSWNKNGHLEKPETILKYELPMYKMDSDDEPDYSQPIDYSQQNQLTKNFTFQAKVPYELKGWSESEDLSKMDQEVLREKVLKFCENLINNYKDENFDYVKTKYLKADIEWYQSEYLKPDVIKKYQNAMNANKGKFKNTFIPLSKYKLPIHGNNKIISIERSDIENKGKSIFLYEKTDNEGNKKIIALDLYLHIPKGSKELEIIR